MRGTLMYDPSGAVTGGLPLDRAPHLTLVAAVLAWDPAPTGMRAPDRAQIGLQLTGHPVRGRRPPPAVRGTPGGQRATPADHGGAAGINEPSPDRARLFQALYRALDRLDTTQQPKPAH
ncbi:restriction endonuclease [Streptomyces griseus]|uniref:restriction endonuclease n=1 Tax=Streptomyces griseus TaxID=1911 RepID=UPI0033B5500E